MSPLHGNESIWVIHQQASNAWPHATFWFRAVAIGAESVVGPQVGFTTNENMLVCAPTGAGKTNIAMISVLHEISQHRDGASGHIAKDDFKIVYVAPMKALAAEVTRTFGSRLEALGIQVRGSVK